MRTLLMIVIRLVVSVLLTACVLALAVIASPAVRGDWRIGSALGVALTTTFFVLLSWVWPGRRP
jgi:hypothetical protein